MCLGGHCWCECSINRKEQRVLHQPHPAPDIVEANLDGRQPPGLTDPAVAAAAVSVEWESQRRELCRSENAPGVPSCIIYGPLRWVLADARVSPLAAFNPLCFHLRVGTVSRMLPCRDLPS